MRIRKVMSSRADRRRFVSFPHDLYRDEPLWIPPMRTVEMAALHRSHPLYRHSEADFFVAEDAGRLTGRIALFEHRPSNELRASHIAFFGYFESIDDQSTADSLFETAVVWVSERSLTSLVGSNGLLSSNGHGVLANGFDLPPVLGAAYHHRYYDRLIRNAGLTPATDYLSGQVRTTHKVPDQIFSMADAVADAGGYTMKTFSSKREIKPWILRLGRMYNETMSGGWGYTPVDNVEIEAMVKKFLLIADPRLVLLLMQDDAVVGYLLILPDVSDAIRAIRGRLLPFGWIRLKRATKRTRKTTILAMGLVPEHRGSGANLVLYAALVRGAQKYDFVGAEIVQVEEGNIPMMRNMEALDVPWTKRHRMYSREVQAKP